MKIGIIGGSGLYQFAGFTPTQAHRLETPFGAPSDEYQAGHLAGHEVFFLPRHGRGHRWLPSEINHRANIMGFKLLGVERILSVTAVGSLREDFRPRDVVLPDQYFDRTKAGAAHTFFGNGVAAHVSMADPVCPALRRAALDAAREVVEADPEFRELRVHDGGTYVNMEGPAFSTKAESKFYRQCGFDIIGMTSLGEARLSREAGLCYASVAMVTDYDCWHETVEPVTVELVIQTVQANGRLAQHILWRSLERLPPKRDCACADALRGAVMTDPALIPEGLKRSLGPILPGQ
jgi:5'-methylthioadenosine phosphorylase